TPPRPAAVARSATSASPGWPVPPAVVVVHTLSRPVGFPGQEALVDAGPGDKAVDGESEQDRHHDVDPPHLDHHFSCDPDYLPPMRESNGRLSSVARSAAFSGCAFSGGWSRAAPPAVMIAASKALVMMMTWPEGGPAGSLSRFSQIGTRVPAAVRTSPATLTAVSRPDLPRPSDAGQRARMSHVGVSLLPRALWLRI